MKNMKHQVISALIVKSLSPPTGFTSRRFVELRHILLFKRGFSISIQKLNFVCCYVCLMLMSLALSGEF